MTELFMLLEIGRQNGEAFRKSLAAYLGMDQATLSRILVRNEKRELISSQLAANPKGKGRSVKVYTLTDKGIEKLRKLLMQLRRLGREAGIEE